MSVKERLDDARILYDNNRREGALLSVLIAVAATSRKRYPQRTLTDRDAFTRFVGEEMLTITRVVQNFNVNYRGQMRPLQDFLYKFVRCQLAHEAELPADIIFVPGSGLQVSVEPIRIVFSDVLIDGLARAVEKAPENAAFSQ
jgi:hypothetical protein